MPLCSTSTFNAMADPSNTTDPILQQLFQAVSSLQQDIAEMKKKDTKKEKDDAT